MGIKIIAEVGVNHNGSYSEAKKYIDICKNIGADFVKFQIAKPELVVIKDAPQAKYQIKNSKRNESQLSMLQRLHLSFEEYKQLYQYSKQRKIDLIFSSFDSLSIDFLLKLNPKYIKIPSGEIDNFFDLKKLKNYKGKIIVSSGMSKLKDISDLLIFLKSLKIKKNQLILMHCNSDYPTDYNDVNLNVLEKFKKDFNLEIGYSDHTKDDLVPIACAVKQINYLEKHITTNRNNKGPDHKASMEIKDFKKMINKIKSVEKCLGSNIKSITKSEIINKNHVRKSLRVNKDIGKGHLITERDLIAMRPANGISPKNYKKFINTISKKNYKKFDSI